MNEDYGFFSGNISEKVFAFSDDIGIDLGTATVLVPLREEGVVLEQTIGCGG